MKLSIITINYNNLPGLRKTMGSVFAQSCQDFEYLVIDGASTDGSAEYVRAHANRLTYWVSEKDTGIYNAMNKGVRAAKGEYLLMLNSGDFLIDNHVVERILPELDGTDIVQGNIIMMHDGRETVNRGYGRSDISFIDVMKNHFLHQASFGKRTLFDQYGDFDESYHINGDTVFYAKCLGFGNATFKYVDHNIAYFDTTGISADPDGKWATLRKDEDKRYEQMFSKRMWDLFYNDEKKINLYNKLHAHKWSWGITMLVARLVQLIHRNH